MLACPARMMLQFLDACCSPTCFPHWQLYVSAAGSLLVSAEAKRVNLNFVTERPISGTVEREGSRPLTIEITSPDVEALIRQRMQAGSFKSPEDLFRAVLRSSAPDTRTGAELIAAMQACPYPEVDIEPARVPSPLVRDVPL